MNKEIIMFMIILILFIIFMFLSFWIGYEKGVKDICDLIFLEKGLLCY